MQTHKSGQIYIKRNFLISFILHTNSLPDFHISPFPYWRVLLKDVNSGHTTMSLQCTIYQHLVIKWKNMQNVKQPINVISTSLLKCIPKYECILEPSYNLVTNKARMLTHIQGYVKLFLWIGNMKIELLWRKMYEW